MSFASARTPNVNSINDACNYYQVIGSVSLPLPSGVQTNFLTVELPIGLYGGNLFIEYQGDATTVIDRMDLIATTVGSVGVFRTNILTGVTLPDTIANYFTYPIASGFLNTQANPNQITYSIEATYTGTGLLLNFSTFQATKFL